MIKFWKNIFTFNILNFENQKLDLILFHSSRCNNTHDTGIIIIIWVCFILIFAIHVLEVHLWTLSYMQNKFYNFFIFQSRLQLMSLTWNYSINYLLYCSVSSMPYISLIKELCIFPHRLYILSLVFCKEFIRQPSAKYAPLVTPT